ncbi:winged helix-turn-helix transcriptional regulator [Paracoccus luteus]|uniref:winged helix-turn-helix transcriptional regulator n=1 Tax=Paracoccus luteus TaxID=2508543 RepID=UPI00106F94D3|nr:helix-turn-helix domain-containing protein [Paracoccus luteus]
MAENRKSYGEGCIAAHALDLIGDRWSLLVVRELMLGPKRFGAIKARLPGIATNMLARRLEDLAAGGIVARADAAGASGYALTAQGDAVWPVVRELCRWGAGMAGHDPRLPISPTALMLSMRATIRPAGRFTAGFDMDGESFALTADASGLHIRRADAAVGEMSFAGQPNDMASAIYGPVPLAQVAATGRVRFTGDLARGQGFVDLFRLRRPVPAGEDA